MAYQIDDFYPRDEAHRFRIYARRGDDLRVVAAGPDIHVMLTTLDEDAEREGEHLYEQGALGILDAVRGRWLVHPWHRPERPATVGELERRLD